MVGRRTLLFGMTAVAAGAAVSACSRDPWWAGSSGRLRIATGNVGAVFERYGAALAREVSSVMPEVSSTTVRTGGSVENVEQLRAGSADIAFCLGDTAQLAFDSKAPFEEKVELTALARLYDSFLQVLVPRDSGLVSLSSLRGKRIFAGEVDSGTRLVMARCLAAAGVGETAEFVDVPLDQATRALERGDVDALAFVSGFPIPALVELADRLPLRALDLGGLVGPLVSAWGPQYVAGPLSAEPYRLPAAVETVSVKTYMLARPDLRDSLAYGVTTVIFDRQQEIDRRVPDVRQPTAAAGIFTQPVPLHPGSLRYFRDR